MEIDGANFFVYSKIAILFSREKCFVNCFVEIVRTTDAASYYKSNSQLSNRRGTGTGEVRVHFSHGGEFIHSFVHDSALTFRNLLLIRCHCFFNLTEGRTFSTRYRFV